MPTYRLTKYALGGVTMLWAGALKGRIAVNSLDPGWLKTDLGGPNAPGQAGRRRAAHVGNLFSTLERDRNVLARQSGNFILNAPAAAE